MRRAVLVGLMLLSAPPAQAANNPGETAKAGIAELGLQGDLPRHAFKVASGTGDPAGRNARDAIRDQDLQGDLPADALTPKEKSTPVSLNTFLNSFFSNGLRSLLWIIVVISTLVIGWLLRDSLPIWDRSRKIVASADGLGTAPRRDAMSVAQLEADDLARLGRFVEAMHVLLLQSLAEMRRLLGITIADSLTSREILRRVQLPDAGHASLGSIIQQVERTYFGEQAADAGDYQTCRQNYETLKQTLVAGGAA